MAAGRTLSSLRTPRGTNFIRLAFAFVFLVGFLGITGFLVRDYLPNLFPGQTGQADVEPPAPDLTLQSPASNSSQSNSIGSPQPIKSVESSASIPPLIVANSSPSPGFDPVETVTKPPQAAPPQSAKPLPVPAPVTVPGTEMAVNKANGALLEVPSKAVVDNDVSTPTAPSGTGRHSIDEDAVPSEAKPAVESLKKFLAAKSLDERLPLTLGAELMKPLMERYYTRSTDGPVIVDRIQFVRMDPNPELGSGRHCILSLENKTWEFPVPVMLEEQANIFKVDWLAFVEFKDRLLEKFFQRYQEGPARFHVGIIRQHYFEDGVPNLDRKDVFRIMPAPPNPYQASVFLDKDSQLSEELKTRLPWETHIWAVVELEWKKLGSQQWVELSAVPQLHWYSLPLTAVSATHQNSETEKTLPGISKNGSSVKSLPAATLPASGESDAPPPMIRRPLPVGR